MPGVDVADGGAAALRPRSTTASSASICEPRKWRVAGGGSPVGATKRRRSNS
jgi:hypothetical protein